MNSALKLAFEEEIRRPLFGSSSILKLQKATEKQRSLKVAVVTTDCLTDEAVLMSNYNKRDQSRGGYLILLVAYSLLITSPQELESAVKTHQQMSWKSGKRESSH
jgi:hypothetical protein